MEESEKFYQEQDYWTELLDDTLAKPREIPEDELSQILANHKKWIESDGKEGIRANISKANLSKSQLELANLQMANLINARLQESHLNRANLIGASMYNANLQRAGLRYANLQDAALVGANLINASFESAKLKGANLAYANLQKANLSKADMQNTALGNVKGLATANLQYSNLEGATGLLGNEFAQADVTGTKLPDDIKEFKALETVEKTSQNARKIFFTMLLGCVYSWLAIATTTDVRLLTNTALSPLPIIGTEIPIAWFYIAAPLVLICLYFYFHLYLIKLWEGLGGLPAIFPDGKRLDERAYPWLLNGLVRRHFRLLKADRPFMAHIQEWITVFLAWWVVPFTMIYFWLRYIPGHDWIGTCLHILLIVGSFAFSIIFYRICVLTLQGSEKVGFKFKEFWSDRKFFLGRSVAIVAILFSLISYGTIEGVRLPYRTSKVNFGNFKEIMPWIFLKFGYNVFADLKEKQVSQRPDNYWDIPKINQLKYVKGANLRYRDLRYANMYRAFLVKANLDLANLQNADLRYADLQGADLWETELQNAKLENAKLMNVFALGAYMHYAKLKNVNFLEADLSFVDFVEADLKDAILYDADLTHADLARAKNLTIDQLSKVKTLYKAKLDPELMEQVKKCCPHLLEEPKEETDKTK